jgi:hypothetical protein
MNITVVRQVALEFSCVAPRFNTVEFTSWNFLKNDLSPIFISTNDSTSVHVHQFTRIPFCYCGAIVLKKNLSEINFKTS